MWPHACDPRSFSHTQVDLLGVMVWWNIQLNAVSLVNLVMVGFPYWYTASHCGKQQLLLLLSCQRYEAGMSGPSAGV